MSEPTQASAAETTPDDAPPAAVQTLRRALRDAVLGQEALVDDLIVAALAGGHVLVEGAPGLGKTRLVRAFADATDLRFGRVQFTPDLMPADVTGSSVFLEDGGGRFEFRPGPIFCNVLLADEINRATPKTQSALLEAMQEHAVTASGERHALPEPFLVLATQNAVEMEGTYPLPEAQLDRFLFKLIVPRPDPDTLVAVLDATTGDPEAPPTAVLAHDDLAILQARLRAVPIARAGLDYAARLVDASHALPGVRLGASPRGAQALVLAGKGYALLEGRPHVRYADLKRAALPALRHRLLPSFEAEVEGRDVDDLVRDLLGRVPEVAPGG
ncbi:MAG: MoxR family ATPase [Trueperaceae bacterium]|nr:MoxR family ATPase [Trueperaceae bacterium]